MKKGTLNQLAQVLDSCKTATLSSDARKALTRNYIAISSIAEELEKKRKEISKKLLPERLAELEKIEKRTDAEEAERVELVGKVNAEFYEIYAPFLDEDVDVALTTISEEEFDLLIDENKEMQARGLAFLHKYLVATPTAESPKKKGAKK